MVVKNGEEVVKSEVVKLEPVVKSPEVVKVVKTSENILQPSPVVKNESLQPKEVLQPNLQPEKPVEPFQCPRCPTLENSITNFYNLVLKEQEKTKEAQKTIQTQNKELTIKNQEKEKLLKELSEHKQIINNLQTKNNSLIQKYNKLENQIKIKVIIL
jgi:predicted ribosome quality control (RQC) complex YloA/Tae2 family protein